MTEELKQDLIVLKDNLQRDMDFADTIHKATNCNATKSAIVLFKKAHRIFNRFLNDKIDGKVKGK